MLGWDKNTLFFLLSFVDSYKTDIWVRLQFLFPFAILFCLRKGQRRLPLKFFTLVLMQFLGNQLLEFYQQENPGLA